MSLPTPVLLTTQPTPVTLAPLRMVSSEKEPAMSRGTIIPIFPIPMGYFHEDERPRYHVPPACPSWLRRLWRHLVTHTPAASSIVSVPQDERRRARTRYPCDIYG
jgi:hypothetical protein